MVVKACMGVSLSCLPVVKGTVKMNVSATCTDASPLISFPGHAMKCGSYSGAHGMGV